MSAISQHSASDLRDQSRKQAIASRFSKAATTYDASAAFQRRVGLRLLESESLLGSEALDLGCGTGFFTLQLLDRKLNVTAADISSAMITHAKSRCGAKANYVVADAEALPFEDNSFDLVYSSLALQWCENLCFPLSEIRRVLKPGGKLLFSTLLEGSLYELKLAWMQADGAMRVNQFLSEKQVKIALAQAGFSHFRLDCYSDVVRYSSALAVMKDLKGIGATYLNQQPLSGLSGKRRIAAVEEAYESFRLVCGNLPATYQVCLGVIYNND